MDQDLRALLIKHEGLRLMPYVDQIGKVSIGIGRNLADKGITLDECEAMFQGDVAEASGHLQRIFPECGSWPAARRAALVDMMFNLGVGGFSQFKDMIAAVQVGDWAMAACAMRDSLWAAQLPSRVSELAVMVESGSYEGRRTAKQKGVLPGIIAVIGAILPGLLKRKKFVLWYRGPDRQPYLLVDFAIFREGVTLPSPWFRKSAPMSKRQCEKTRDDLWALGPGVPISPIFPDKAVPT